MTFNDIYNTHPHTHISESVLATTAAPPVTTVPDAPPVTTVPDDTDTDAIPNAVVVEINGFTPSMVITTQVNSFCTESFPSSSLLRIRGVLEKPQQMQLMITVRTMSVW